MPDKKTYRGPRLSSGLNEEHNNVFKNRAMEIKGEQAKKTEPEREPEVKKSALKAPTEKKKLAPPKKSVPETKKKERDDFDLTSEDDDEDVRGSSRPRPRVKPAQKSGVSKSRAVPKPETTKALQRVGLKSIHNAITVLSSDEDVSNAKPAEKKAFNNAKEKKPTSNAAREEKAATTTKEKKSTSTSKEEKITSYRAEKQPATTSKDKVSIAPKETKLVTTAAETKKDDGKRSKLSEKRKAKASSDDEHEETKVQPKKSKTSTADKKYIIKPSESKSTAVKRKGKSSLEDSDEEYGPKPLKRQDSRAKSPNLPDPRKKQTANKPKAAASKKPISRKPTIAAAKARMVSTTTPSTEEDSTTSGSPNFKVPDVVYDHAVDISYLPMSSPELSAKTKKLPSLAKEPSGIAELNDLIDSQIAEIGEEPVKKAKKTTKKEVKKPRKTAQLDADDFSLIEDFVEAGGLLPDSTGAREADQQSLVNAVMFSAEKGVRTTRAKLRNQAAAKKSYGVGQRTMRKPITEEEELEDQRLEFQRVLQAQAEKEAKMQREVKLKEAEAEASKASKSEKGKRGPKAKLAKKDSYDLDDEEEGPKVVSRHALLQSGKHQRTMNEIESLMEDAFRGQIVTRRSAFIDFAQIMSVNNEKGRDYIQKFRFNAYDSALMKDLDKEEDAITRIGCGWIMFILLNEERYSGRAIELFLSNGSFEMLKTMLQDNQDLDALSESSVLQNPIQINKYKGFIRQRMLQCRFIGNHTPESLSQQYVTLMILNTILKNVNQADGKKLILELFDPHQFVEILAPLATFESPPQGSKLTNFALSVSILSQYCQIAQVYKPLKDLLASDDLSLLSELLPRILEWDVHEELSQRESILDFQASVLKLTIDRTNEDPVLCTSISDRRNGLMLITQKYINQFGRISNNADPERDMEKEIDILVLTGILLSNLLEFSEMARSFLRTQQLGTVMLVRSLMEVFVQRHSKLELAESFEETHLNVAFGYLAVALAYACRDDKTRKQVHSQLSGSLDPLITTIATFKAQNQALEDAELAESQTADEEIIQSGDSASNAFSYTRRLEDILNELRAR